MGADKPGPSGDQRAFKVKFHPDSTPQASLPPPLQFFLITTKSTKGTKERHNGRGLVYFLRALRVLRGLHSGFQKTEQKTLPY
jgi:hypothetical protein